MNLSNSEQIDRKAVLALTGEDKNILNAVLIRMRADNSRDLADLDRALSSERWQQVAHHLHRLAGSVRLAGCEPLAQQCAEMESIALNAPDSAALREEFAFLLAQFRLLDREITLWLLET